MGMATPSNTFTPMSQAQQYPYPPASAPPDTQFPSSSRPLSSADQPSQIQNYGFPPENCPFPMNAYPPPPNAPPTPAYTPTSHNGSTYPAPSQHSPQTYPQQWSGNGQPTYYQSANAPPTPAYSPYTPYSPTRTEEPRNQASPQAPANLTQTPYTPYSPTRTEECRNQASYQAQVNLPPTPQYTPAAYGFGGSAPQTLGGYQTSYFPQQQQAQSTQTQPAPTQAVPPPPQSYSQNPVLAAPSGTESVQLDLSKLSLNEPEPPLSQTLQHPSSAQTQNSVPTPTSNYPSNVPQEKAELQQDWVQPLPSITYHQPAQYGRQPSAVQFPPPPPPYSPTPQADPNLSPFMTQEIKPQQSQIEQTQQQQQYEHQPQYHQQQYQQQQYQQQQYQQQQAQMYVPQPSPYHGIVQQQQYTQVQVQNPVMGLQQPQYAQAQIQQYQQVQPVQQVQLAYGQEAPPGVLAHRPGKDDQETSKVTRFLGDTLVGRFARSSVSTVTTTLKMPAVLSPWGDNNPVTLPNVRYRDAALFGTFAVIGAPLMDGVSDVVTSSFGADHFISEVVSSGAGFITGNTIVKYGVFQIVEQAIDKGVLEHVLPEVEKTMRTTTAKTLQVSIKHKLMGVEADIRMHGPYPASNSMACDKGWFAPYLFASSRTPVIRRSEDFAMAQFFKPYLMADTHLTHKLLTESASVIPLCDPTPSARLAHARLLVTFIGISPFRGEGSGMWSTSRRPGCGQLRIHLLNGCPTLVLPATQRAPVIAWSPWTLKQMHEGGTPQKQHQEVCSWLLGLVERGAVYPGVASNVGCLERVVARVVTMIINGALMAPRGGKVCGVVDWERAGIVVMRY